MGVASESFLFAKGPFCTFTCCQGQGGSYALAAVKRQQLKVHPAVGMGGLRKHEQASSLNMYGPGSSPVLHLGRVYIYIYSYLHNYVYHAYIVSFQ